MGTALFFRQISGLSSAKTIAAGANILASAVVAAGGSGYRVNDVLTLSGGTALRVARVQVLTVDPTGAVLTVAVADMGYSCGAYTSNPGNPVSTTGGSGTGCTLTATFTADAIPHDVGYAVVQAVAQDVRFRLDGTNPTATIGEQIKADDSVILAGKDVRTALFIEEAASALLNVTYYKN